MSLTPNYNPSELCPKVIIKDNDGTTRLQYETIRTAASPVQKFDVDGDGIGGADDVDVKLTDFSLNLGINDNYGSLVLVFVDHDNDLVDDSTGKRHCRINREWEIQFSLGKTSSTVNRYFYGKIKEADILRAGTNQCQIVLTCVGWGIILKERVTRLVKNQAKESDGITLDDTDTSTTIENLILSLFNDVDHYVDDNITQLANISTSGLCSNCLSTKLANINTSLSTFAQVISDLAGTANATWFVDPDRVLTVLDPSAHDSGFLITNNLSGDVAQNWSNTKISYLKNMPVDWRDSSNDTYYNFIHASGHFNPVLDVSFETTPDAAENLDDRWVAIPFTPNKTSLFKIALKAIKTGTPAADGSIQIWGATTDATPEPDPNNVIVTVHMNKKKLQALGTSTPADWFEIPIKSRINLIPDQKYFIVIPKNGTASHTWNVNYLAGDTTSLYWFSTDGATWTETTGGTGGTMNYRVYNGKRLITTLEITETGKKLPEVRERMYPVRADLEEESVRETLLNAANLLGKQKRVYDKINITPPTDRILPGKFLRLQDQKTGLDVRPIITGVEIEGHIDANRFGATTVTVSLEDYVLT